MCLSGVFMRLYLPRRPVLAEKPSSFNQFALEELEARVLLSADGLGVGMGAEDSYSSLGPEPDSVIEIVHEESELSQSGDENFDWSGGNVENLLVPLESEVLEDVDGNDSADVDTVGRDDELSSIEEEPSASPESVLETDETSPQEERSALAFSGFDSQDLVVNQLVDTLNAANGPPVIGENDPKQSISDTNTFRWDGNLLPVPSNNPSSEAAFLLDSASELSGNGVIGGHLVNNGVLSPGNSPGVFSVAGDLVLNQGGSVIIEIGGPTPATDSASTIALEPNPAPASDSAYDQINVQGHLTLGGALDVRLINGFTPTLGQSFDLLNYGTVSGGFSDLSLIHI